VSNKSFLYFFQKLVLLVLLSDQCTSYGPSETELAPSSDKNFRARYARPSVCYFEIFDSCRKLRPFSAAVNFFSDSVDIKQCIFQAKQKLIWNNFWLASLAVPLLFLCAQSFFLLKYNLTQKS